MDGSDLGDDKIWGDDDDQSLHVESKVPILFSNLLYTHRLNRTPAIMKSPQQFHHSGAYIQILLSLSHPQLLQAPV